MQDKISIVTGVRNGERFIRQTVESVLQQFGPRVEHIVVDGASMDRTVDVLKSYPHLRWISEPDKGQGEAIEKGIRMATGTVICILPADDMLLPGAVQSVLDVFDGDPSCRWVAGRCRIVDSDGREIRRFITWYKNMLLRFHSFPLLLTECYLSAMAVFFKRSMYDEFVPYDMDKTTEHDLWLKFAKKYPLKTLSRYVACFRVYRASNTGSFQVFPAKRALNTVLRHGAGHPIALTMARINYYRLVLAYSLMNRLLR